MTVPLPASSSYRTGYDFSADPRLPEPHAAFLDHALLRLWEMRRIVGVAAGGSFLTGRLDEHSDLDLVVAVEPAVFGEVLAERTELAAELGTLLSAATGEHVGEPRLLICLYGPWPLHVDFKFVSLPDLADRVEDPVILWQRQERLTAAMSGTEAEWPPPDLQWMEDRFWMWIHYGARRIARGEIFEAQDILASLRSRVLGPLMLRLAGVQPSGVRRVETFCPRWARRLEATVAPYEPCPLAEALAAAVEVYRDLRRALAEGDGLTPRTGAERASRRYLEEVRRSCRDSGARGLRR